MSISERKAQEMLLLERSPKHIDYQKGGLFKHNLPHYLQAKMVTPHAWDLRY